MLLPTRAHLDKILDDLQVNNAYEQSILTLALDKQPRAILDRNSDSFVIRTYSKLFKRKCRIYFVNRPHIKLGSYSGNSILIIKHSIDPVAEIIRMRSIAYLNKKYGHYDLYIGRRNAKKVLPKLTDKNIFKYGIHIAMPQYNCVMVDNYELDIEKITATINDNNEKSSNRYFKKLDLGTEQGAIAGILYDKFKLRCSIGKSGFTIAVLWKFSNLIISKHDNQYAITYNGLSIYKTGSYEKLCDATPKVMAYLIDAFKLISEIE